jgi:hypothetical protein
MSEFSEPPPDAEVLCNRLLLALDADNGPAYQTAFLDMMRSPRLAWRVTNTLVSTLRILLEKTDPGWQDDNAERQLLLLDSLEWLEEQRRGRT